MTAIRIDTGAVRIATTRLAAANTTASLASALSVASSAAAPVFRVAGDLQGLFSASNRLVMEIQGDIDALTRTVNSISESYEATEAALARRFHADPVGSLLHSVLSGKPLEIEGALLGRSATMGGVTASASVLGGKASLEKVGKWDMSKGEAYTGVKAGVEGWLGRASVKGDLGLIHGEAEVNVGRVKAEGELRASLFTDGKFNPGVGVKGSAEATALSASAEGRLGTDYFDVHGKVDGKLYTASAEGEVNFGADGIKVGGKAEAYAATGKVSGGLNLGLFKIDFEAEGKAGGAGVELGAAAGRDSVSGTIGAGLGLGGSLSFKIDWSGAGEFIDNVGTAVGEVGGAIAGAAESIGSFLGDVGAGIASLWNWH